MTPTQLIKQSAYQIGLEAVKNLETDKIVSDIEDAACEIAAKAIDDDPDLYLRINRDEILAEKVAESNAFIELTGKLSRAVVRGEEVQGRIQDAFG